MTQVVTAILVFMVGGLSSFCCSNGKSYLLVIFISQAFVAHAPSSGFSIKLNLLRSFIKLLSFVG